MRGVRAARKLVVEARAVQADGLRVLSEMRVIERALVLEQGMVHFPEVSLRRGSFGGFGRAFGMGMRLPVMGKLRKHRSEAAIRADVCTAFTIGSTQAAMRAFVVAVLDERDRGGRWSRAVIAVGDQVISSAS